MGLDCHNLGGAGTEQQSRAVADMCPDVEREIAGPHEPSIEARTSTLASHRANAVAELRDGHRAIVP